jgi:hypothetical protein
MASFWMLRRVAFVGTDVSEEPVASSNVVPSSPILVTLMIEVLSSSKTSDAIFHSHRRENLKYYMELTGWDL